MAEMETSMELKGTCPVGHSAQRVFRMCKTSEPILLQQWFTPFKWVPGIIFRIGQERWRILPLVTHFRARVNIKT